MRLNRRELAAYRVQTRDEWNALTRAEQRDYLHWYHTACRCADCRELRVLCRDDGRTRHDLRLIAQEYRGMGRATR